MKYKVETHSGCTASNIVVNDKNYYGEDPRYKLSDDERTQFEEDLFLEIRRMYDDGEIGVDDLLQLLPPEDYKESPTCETCFDTVISYYYEF